MYKCTNVPMPFSNVSKRLNSQIKHIMYVLYYACIIFKSLYANEVTKECCHHVQSYNG